MTMPLPIGEYVYQRDRICWHRSAATLRSCDDRFHVLRRADRRWVLYDRGKPVTDSGRADGQPHTFERQRDAKEHAAYLITGERLHAAGLVQDPLRW